MTSTYRPVKPRSYASVDGRDPASNAAVMTRGGTPEQREALAARIRTARELAYPDKPAAESAAAIGVKEATYYRYESRTKPLEPSAFVLEALAKHFGVTTDWLLHGSEEMPQAYWDWRETPRAKAADERAFPWIESRSYGYPGSAEYYDALLFAWEQGLRDREIAELGARETARLRQEAKKI